MNCFYLIIPLLYFGSSDFNIVPGQTEMDYRSFDFWIGDWIVYNWGTDKIAGYNIIEPIIDSFALRETYYTPGNKYKGTSTNKYNPSIKKWEQFWVDNSGLTLHLQGNLAKDKMILIGSRISPTGSVLDKIAWTNIGDGTVRQEWFTSTDAGDNWNKIFDGHYKPRK